MSRLVSFNSNLFHFRFCCHAGPGAWQCPGAAGTARSEPGAPNTALGVALGLGRGALAPALLAEEAAGGSAESNLRNHSCTNIPALLLGVPLPAAAPGSCHGRRDSPRDF